MYLYKEDNILALALYYVLNIYGDFEEIFKILKLLS